ncbi:MAG: pirin [Myxococcales bacterium]|nr:pirin [Myxococcales bacterium]|tara:strand:- start:36 stop:1181 length:1146 start_codon:yes stop_codon:yes gene_type:complete
MKDITRRDALKGLGATGAAASLGCLKPSTKARAVEKKEPTMTQPEFQTVALPQGATPWPTQEPFLFCVHHNDKYPAGNEQHGPAASLEGRRIGQDFEGKDGWRMYHGDVVPGFPRHPHRGFETITVVREGLIDHADSLGAAARYGEGDVQWLTAGDGINHAEMFPLLDKEKTNETNFFQIWLNLPAAQKRVPPHFTMFWDKQIPVVSTKDAAGRATVVTVIAGQYDQATALSPPPNSWASTSESDVAIFTVKMAPHAQWTLPASRAGTTRTLYTVTGDGIVVANQNVSNRYQVIFKNEVAVEITNGSQETELLLLQAKPIGEPIARYGPFVMNTQAEIQEAFRDYRRTEFGGWPWKGSDPVHGGKKERFARHADGREEKPV